MEQYSETTPSTTFFIALSPRLRCVAANQLLRHPSLFALLLLFVVVKGSFLLCQNSYTFGINAVTRVMKLLENKSQASKRAS